MSSNENQEGLLEDPNAGSGTNSRRTEDHGTVSSTSTTEARAGTQDQTATSPTEYMTTSGSDEPTDRSAVIEGDEDAGTSDRAYATASDAPDMGTATTGTMNIDQIQNGWDVYGSDGEKVGDVDEVGPNYVLVQKGMFFTKDLYVPTSAITDIEDDRVTLNVTKDQVESMGWDEPPMADVDSASASSVRSGTGTDQTMSTGAAQEYITTEHAEPARTMETDDDDVRVQRHEEELQATKSTRDSGEVRVSKDVVEEEQTLEVPVTREQVTVRSVDASDSTSETSEAFQGGTISVPVREEGVEVDKQTRVAEEVEIDKRTVESTEGVTDTVRREQVNIEELGNVDVDRRSDNPLDEDVRAR